MRRCPHCGNTDSRFIQDNGDSPRSPDLTLLCVARVKPADWSFVEMPEPDQIGDDGLTACGMQWEPNR